MWSQCNVIVIPFFYQMYRYENNVSNDIAKVIRCPEKGDIILLTIRYEVISYDGMYRLCKYLIQRRDDKEGFNLWSNMLIVKWFDVEITGLHFNTVGVGSNSQPLAGVENLERDTYCHLLFEFLWMCWFVWLFFRRLREDFNNSKTTL